MVDLRNLSKEIFFHLCKFPFNLSFLFIPEKENMKTLTKDYCEAALTLHISTIAEREIFGTKEQKNSFIRKMLNYHSIHINVYAHSFKLILETTFMTALTGEMNSWYDEKLH